MQYVVHEVSFTNCEVKTNFYAQIGAQIKLPVNHQHLKTHSKLNFKFTATQYEAVKYLPVASYILL